MTYLIDTSALVRLQRDQGGTAWKDVIARGLVAVCSPVMAETLLIADAKEYASVERAIYASYLKVTVPDGIWDLADAIRHELVPPSAYFGLSVADLVVAATAIRLKLTVLHEDGDFETMARYVQGLQQQRLSSPPR